VRVTDEGITQFEGVKGVEDIRIGARTAAEREKSRIPSMVAEKTPHLVAPCKSMDVK